MGYKKPEDVVSPRDRWTYERTLVNTGQGGFSVVEGQWDNSLQVGVRWNGDDLSGSSGSPQSTGKPIWFILPTELQSAVRDAAAALHWAMHGISCDLSQLDRYEYGVFKVDVKIIDPALLDAMSGCTVFFDLPQLEHRLFRNWTEKFDEYFAAPTMMGGPWRGKIINGAWVGIVQTNGVMESMNETTRTIVRDALIERVAAAVVSYK